MKHIVENAIKTRSYMVLGEHHLAPNARYVYACSEIDDRSDLAVWHAKEQATPNDCVSVVQEHPDKIDIYTNNSLSTIFLRDDEGLRSIWGGRHHVYLDITGMSHHVWAPLVRSSLESAKTVEIVYAEPHQYRFHSSPASSTIFNLSDSFTGVSPLPGFAKLQGPEGDSPTLFVAFLGFEGMRASQIAITLESVGRIIPILGIPGFQMEFPAHAISCNREFLEEARAFSEIQLAKANCPFEAYQTLEHITNDNPSAYLYVAPVGTKPHALGAVLFAINNPASVEIVYDHPVRSRKRSSGIGAIHIYRLK